MDPLQTQAFADELQKIAAAHGRWHTPKTRSGKRSMKVSTLLKKDKAGTLSKNTGNDHKIAQIQPFLAGNTTGAEAPRVKKKGDLPSRDEMDGNPKREDGRGSATTVLGTGNFILAPDVGGRERAE